MGGAEARCKPVIPRVSSRTVSGLGACQKRHARREAPVVATVPKGPAQPLTDDFVIHRGVLGAGQALRYLKELTRRNSQRLDDLHALNLRVDYRRQLGPVDW